MPKSFFRRFTKGMFVTTNIIVGILFFIGCYVNLFNPLYFWFLGFVNLIAFYLLALLIIFIVFWIVVKPRYSFISLISIAICFTAIQHIIPFRKGSSFTKEKQAQALRVMSWNVSSFDLIAYSKTGDKTVFNGMMDLMKEYQPDVLCMQEVALGDSNITVVHHVKGLSDTLGMRYYKYSYNEEWYLNLHYGVITYSKYPIVGGHTIMEYPYTYNYTSQCVDILVNADTFRVFNFHLESLKFNPDTYEYLDKPISEQAKDLDKSKSIISRIKHGYIRRYHQVNKIKKEIEQSPYPVIVCGDFNDVPNSYPYKELGKGLKNSFVEKGSGLGRTFMSISPTLRIDNIFVDPKFDVLQYNRVKKKLSDHYPIMADIEFKKN